MSFNATVKVADGQASVTVSGDVPDGEYVIAGHEDDHQRTLSVTQRDANGRYVAMANSVHYKEA